MSEEEKEVHQWLEVFRTDTDARLRAATELGLIGIRCRKQGKSVRGSLDKAASSVFPGISFAGFLETALSDGREQVQCEAVFAVGELAGEEVIEPLLECLEGLKPDSTLHTSTMRALTRIGGPKVTDYLLSQPGDLDTVRGVFGLIDKHKADEAFSKEFYTSPDQVPRTSDTPRSVTLAVKIREWLENTHDSGKTSEYVSVLVKQILQPDSL
jgi:hypothetical protein